MLSRRTLEMIVDDCMIKYARENNGAEGWAKDDIANAVYMHGGDQNDMYSAMIIGMEVCFGELDMPGHLIS